MNAQATELCPSDIIGQDQAMAIPREPRDDRTASPSGSLFNIWLRLQTRMPTFGRANANNTDQMLGEKRARGTIRFLAVFVFLLPLALYIVPNRYHGSGDSVPAEVLPIALLRGHGFDLEEFADAHRELPYYFRATRGRVISAYPILPGLLNFPVVGIAHVLHIDVARQRLRLSLITAATVTACSVLLLFLCLVELSGDPTHAFWFALLYATGTNAWSNGGVALFQHGCSLLFLTGAYFCLARRTDSGVWWAGGLLGLAVVSRPTNILFAVPLALYVLLHRRWAVAGFAACAILPATLLGIYSQVYWGSVLMLGQGQGGWGFDGNMLRGAAGLLFSPARGLFVFSPIFVFAVIEGVRHRSRGGHDPLLRYIFTATVLVIALYTKWGNWWGGHSYSYRLLTEVSPGLILLLSEAWRTWIRGIAYLRGLFYAAATISVLVQVLGAWTYPTGFNSNIDLESDRLWNWKQTEITMGVAEGLSRLHIRSRAASWHGGGSEPSVPEPTSRFHFWWNYANNDDDIPGWYDYPVDQHVVRGPLVVDGWAKSVLGDVDVRVILDNGQRIGIPRRYPRPDVGAVLPQLGDISRAGWRVSFDPAPNAPQVHELTVEFRAPNGHVRSLPVLHVRWQP